MALTPSNLNIERSSKKLRRKLMLSGMAATALLKTTWAMAPDRMLRGRRFDLQLTPLQACTQSLMHFTLTKYASLLSHGLSSSRLDALCDVRCKTQCCRDSKHIMCRVNSCQQTMQVTYSFYGHMVRMLRLPAHYVLACGQSLPNMLDICLCQSYTTSFKVTVLQMILSRTWFGMSTWQGIKSKNAAPSPELMRIHELHAEVLEPELLRAFAHAQASLHERARSCSVTVVLKLPGSSIAPQA